MSASSDRFHFIDLLRGFAVVVMVFGHTIDAVLDVESRSTVWFAMYTFCRGFTAPVFLFVSGLSFAVATRKRWADYTRWSPQLFRRIRRIVLLLIVGYALHLPFFSLGKTISAATTPEIMRFLQTDVLQCIAVCLLLLHVMILFLRTPKAFLVGVVTVTLVIAAMTPFVWSVDWEPVLSPVVAPYLSGTDVSPFPLFPYAAYLLAGIILGHLFLYFRETNNPERFMATLATTSAVLALGGVAIDQIPSDIYPAVEFWKTNPVVLLLKLSGVLQLVLLAYVLRRAPGRLQNHCAVLGKASFFIYAAHMVLVYGSAANNGLAFHIGQVLAPAPALVAATGMILLMALVVYGWNVLYNRQTRVAVYGRAALASTVVYLFLSNPY